MRLEKATFAGSGPQGPEVRPVGVRLGSGPETAEVLAVSARNVAEALGPGAGDEVEETLEEMVREGALALMEGADGSLVATTPEHADALGAKRAELPAAEDVHAELLDLVFALADGGKVRLAWTDGGEAMAMLPEEWAELLEGARPVAPEDRPGLGHVCLSVGVLRAMGLAVSAGRDGSASCAAADSAGI